MGDDLYKLQEAFYNFDPDKVGTITLDHLRFIMETEGDNMYDLEDFIAEAANFADGSGNLDYKAFAECMLSGD